LSVSRNGSGASSSALSSFLRAIVAQRFAHRARPVKQLTSGAPPEQRRPVKTSQAAGVLALLAALAVAAPARAGEDEGVIALEPTYGLLGLDSGLGVGASSWVGVSETFWISASGGGDLLFAKAGRRGLYEVFGGVVAALDVLRTIPFAQVEAGVVGTGGH